VLPAIGNDPLAFLNSTGVQSVCGGGIGLGSAYAHHGVRQPDGQALAAPGPNPTKTKIMRNAAIYQDEQTLALGFATACFGAEISAGRAAYDNMPPELRSAGVGQGSLLLVRDAPELYKVVLTKLGWVDSLQSSAPPPFRAQLARIRQAMSRPCKGLCAA
jgi:hypothetical protein